MRLWVANSLHSEANASQAIAELPITITTPYGGP